ncbi:MAG: ATP-binding protein [Microthrixaceae bacterium]|nr:ATP-binding protein [Microthrixaceae bacterium]
MILLAQGRPLEGTYWGIAGAVAAGFAMSAVARVLVPRVRSITWPTSAILALLAGSVAFGLASLADSDPTLPAVLLALALTISFLLAATMVERHFRPAVDIHSTPVPELIRLGESANVEFKSTARRNQHTGERDPAIEGAIARTVCGFLNGRGGTLLVGVADDGEAIGIAVDLPFMKFPDVDGYELFLTDLLRTTLGMPAMSSVRIGFESVDDTTQVCRIDVDPSPFPVYLTPPKGMGAGARNPEFWVRAGNGTRALRIDELLDYHRTRWGGWFRRVFQE